MVFFVKNGQNYERFDETHVQYRYSEAELKTWLAEAGFCAEAYGDPSGGPVKKDSERIYLKAVKHGSVD